MSLHTGQIGETICMLRLLRMGVPCSLVHFLKTDILAQEDKRHIRIQVKSSAYKNSYRRKNGREYWCYHFSICSGGHPKQPLTKAVCDVVALVALDMDKVIFINVEDLKGNVTKRLTKKDFYETCEEDSWKKCFYNRDEQSNKTL